MNKPEYVSLTEVNLSLTSPTPAVAIEYDTSRPYPDDAQRSLSFAMRTLVFAVDAGLRKPELRSEEDKKWLGIMSKVFRGSDYPGVSFTDTYYETQNPEGLHELGHRLAHEITHHHDGPMPHAPASNQIWSGYNTFGDVDISKGYDKDSPQGTNIYDSHWHKRFFSMVKAGDNTLAVGMYAPSDGPQFLSPQILRNELEKPELAKLMQAEPNVRVSEVQPKTISEVAYDSIQQEGAVPNGAKLGNLDEYLATQEETLETQPYAGESTPFIANAGRLILHRSSDLGIAFNLRAIPVNRQEIQFHEDPDLHAALVTDAEGKLTTIEQLIVDVKPIIWTLGNHYPRVQRLHRAGDILLTPSQLAAVEELNLTVAAMRAALIADNS